MTQTSKRVQALEEALQDAITSLTNLLAQHICIEHGRRCECMNRRQALGAIRVGNAALKGEVLAERKTGKVKWFNDSKGFGFIQQKDGPDLFVHFTNIDTPNAFRSLKEGDCVEFEVVQTSKCLTAQHVVKIVEQED